MPMRALNNALAQSVIMLLGSLAVLLSIWFVVSFGFGILLVEQLNRFMLPGTGFRLGFWFAQQGSIYVFIVLIWVYVILMNRLDKRHGVDEGSR